MGSGLISGNIVPSSPRETLYVLTQDLAMAPTHNIVTSHANMILTRRQTPLQGHPRAHMSLLTTAQT